MQPLPKKTISLTTELATASLSAFITALGTFTASLTVATASDVKALSAAGIASGIVALTTFGNSLKNWLAQNNTSS